MNPLCPHRRTRQVRLGTTECVECGALFAMIYARGWGPRGTPKPKPVRTLRPEHEITDRARRYREAGGNKAAAGWRARQQARRIAATRARLFGSEDA